MIAIIKNPGQPAFTRQVENTLAAFQQLVGDTLRLCIFPVRSL